MRQSIIELSAFLSGELEEFDGKSTTLLGEITHRWSNEPHYLEALLELFGDDDPAKQDGATWLFKAFVEGGGPIDTVVSREFSSRAFTLCNWAAKLHVCQSVRHLTFAPDDALRLGDWTGTLLDHRRPFLRAWALDALLHLSSFNSDLRETAQKALAVALEDPSASVRARARNLTMPGDN